MKSESLRLSEVRAVFRLVGECRDLGADPDAWRGHVARSLGPLAGAQVCMTAEADRSAGGGAPGTIVCAFSHGWESPAAEASYASYQTRHEYQRDSTFRSVYAVAGRRGLCTSELAFDRRTWLAAPIRNEIFLGAEIDEFLVTLRDLRGGRRDQICLFRPSGDRGFRRREVRLVGLFHTELTRHVGASLATLDDPSPAGLTPRLRDTLRCLLEGDSEKQVASRLGLSTQTVHQYVKALYRHFRVTSRPELMAYFLRRSGSRLPGRPE